MVIAVAISTIVRCDAPAVVVRGDAPAVVKLDVMLLQLNSTNCILLEVVLLQL